MSALSEWKNYLNKHKSAVTVKNYASCLSLVLDDLNLSPKQLIKLMEKDPDELRSRLKTYFTDKIAGLAPLTKNQRLSALKSFVHFHDDQFNFGRIEFDKSHTQISIFDDEIPTRETLREIFDNAPSDRARAAISLYAFCGLRPMIIVNLKLSDLWDTNIRDGRVEFTKEPAMIVIRKDTPGNKAKVDFFTFLIQEGIDYLERYLNSREDELTNDSPVILYPTVSTPESAKTKMWREISKKAFKKSGFDARPYILRSYFDAHAGDNLRRTKREFYMGHKGDLDVSYHMRKKHTPQKIKQLREEWKEKMEPALSTQI